MVPKLIKCSYIIIYVLVFRKKGKRNVSKIFFAFFLIFFVFFFDFLESFFEEGKEKNFFVFSAFFEERMEKVLIIFGEIREKGKKMDLARMKKIFSASRQKK